MNTYLITYPDGSKILWKGQIKNEGNLVWLCKEGKPIWSVPCKAIRLLHPLEALVQKSEGVKEI
jgi:hypothetical protein